MQTAAASAPTSNEDVVQLADLKIGVDPQRWLVTHALGSCVAVIAWDRRRRIGGMLHLMLPTSAASPARAKAQPAMFADTGIALLLAKMQYSSSSAGDFVVKVVGGGSFQVTIPSLDLGALNRQAVLGVLERHGLRPVATELGGTISRSVRLQVGSGRVLVSSRGGEHPL